MVCDRITEIIEMAQLKISLELIYRYCKRIRKLKVSLGLYLINKCKR